MINDERPDRTELRVLVVEDESLVALIMEDMLTELGHKIVGPVSKVNLGVEMARQEEIDLAILDLNLKGASSLPIADALRERGIPIIFSTGYGRGGLPEPFQDALFLQKPFQQVDIEDVIARAAKINER